MFVQIIVRYQHYGVQGDKSFVGPFTTQEAASDWRNEFNKLWRESTTELVSEVGESRQIIYTPDQTPKQVHDKIWKSIYDYCMG